MYNYFYHRHSPPPRLRLGNDQIDQAEDLESWGTNSKTPEQTRKLEDLILREKQYSFTLFFHNITLSAIVLNTIWQLVLTLFLAETNKIN